MGGIKKERMSITIDPKIKKKLIAYSNWNKISSSLVIESVLGDFLKGDFVNMLAKKEK